METYTNANKYICPTTNTNYLNTNMYDQFIDSLSLGMCKAINAVYNLGYITEDEVKQLKEHGIAYRNEYTYIMIADSYDKVTLYCNERTAGFERIFQLSYLKANGTVIDELNVDIVN